MILHVSIPSNDPKTTANTLAKITKGIAKPLNWCDGGYMVFMKNETNTGIEVLPNDVLFSPGSNPNATLDISRNQNNAKHSCFHFMLVVDSTYEQVASIAEAVGWKTIKKTSLKTTEMLELWVENRLMIEIILETNKAKTIDALAANNYVGCN